MDVSQIKRDFSNYLNNNLKNESTTSQYLSKLNALEKWFLDNGVSEKEFNIWLDSNKIEQINLKLANEFKKLWSTENKEKHNWLSSPWNQWVNFNKTFSTQNSKEITTLQYSIFGQSSKNNGLNFSDSIIIRFISSLLTKPFVILTGLSGSGKTKLAQAFSSWICEDEKQYCIVPVGADWTNREPLLGFPNALIESDYVKPENGVLDLIIAANENPDKPYFLILDEMNLSHVERYFADFLSVMESKGNLSLHAGKNPKNDVPSQIKLTPNFFIIGTVNIDETTYMFSPKVLDRANVIEFRVTAQEMEDYLGGSHILDMEKLIAAGSNMANSFVSFAADKTLQTKDIEEIKAVLLLFFNKLQQLGAEFGYRSASEIIRFAAVINKIEPGWTTNEILDAAIMQKLLPKVHGSRRKLEGIIKVLGGMCLTEAEKIEDYLNAKSTVDFIETDVKYPISLDKIRRMYLGLLNNGFTSYAEA